jgi:phage terminase large subunit-like protein
MPSKRREMSFSEMGSLMKEGLTRTVSRPTIHGYIPHEKQIKFHRSTDKGRLYIGGNRSGKTVGGIVEDIYRMRGVHPYQEVPPAPTLGRIVTVSFTEGIEKIIKPELARWIPPSELINGSWEDSYDKSLRTLTLSNGSTCELMSHDQDLVKFAGVPRHWTHFDEEPPKDIFTECRMRLVDYGGVWYLTMTPVDGMTWVYDDIYLKGITEGGNITVVEIDSSENPYISQAELETVIGELDDNEKRARKQGKFVQIGGLAFTKFDPARHIIPDYNDWPMEKKRAILGWTLYCSLDHGLNNPTAWLWHAVSPSGKVITFDEVYDSGKIVSYYAGEIHRRHKMPDRRPPDLYIGDPAIAQRNAQTGDSIQTAYIQHGIPIVLGNNNVPIGVEKMNRYLELGKWHITENCYMLRRELQRVRWKVYDTAKQRHNNNLREELHKKDDHAPDSARYFFSKMPSLYIPKPGSGDAEYREQVNKLVNENLGGAVSITVPQQQGLTIDQYLTHVETHWQTKAVDEYLGGEW